jgi:hypothetical protein
LHGNETSGWDGMRRYLGEHARLPRSIDLFIGNVDAAAQSLRLLPGQRDFNRLWRNTDEPPAGLAASLVDAIGSREYIAAVDLHNNTGHNPYYSVLTELSAAHFGLALSFSDKAVLIAEPDSTLTHWFSGRCPAIALETGPVGDPRCADRVYDYLIRCLDSDSIEPAEASDLELFHTLGRVHVCDGVEMSFEGDAGHGPLVLSGGVEAVNFHELPVGTVFASTRRSLREVLQVLDTQHRDVTDRFFVQAGTELMLRAPVIPAMYTLDPYVIRQDCLCYFMARLDLGST